MSGSRQQLEVARKRDGEGRLRRFKPYPTYKESGVEWLAEIPAHWKCLSLTRVSLSRCDGPFGSSLKSEHYASSGVRVVRLQNIGWASFLDSDRAYIDEAYARELGDHSVIRGDLLIAGLGDEGHPVGRACTAPEGIEPAIVKADCFRFRLDRTRILPGFASYQLSATASSAAGSLATGATRSRMNLATTASRKVALPPFEEQRAISLFLDQETTKIDALVKKRRQLIELLQEQRSACITQAITQGLDPGAAMKDSGVEWLGVIPAHWEEKRTKFAARLRSGHTPSRQHPEYWQDCTIPWFGLADVWQIRDGEIEYVTNTAEKISELGLANSAARLLPKGTVMLSRTASVGFSAIMGVDMATTQDFVNWVCGSTLRPEYLLYVFRSMQHEFHRLTMGSTHQTIYMPDVGNFSTPIPPIREQDRIVIYVRERIRRVDALVVKVREAIDLLEELRTALISAAVTGKIDVREEPA